MNDPSLPSLFPPTKSLNHCWTTIKVIIFIHIIILIPFKHLFLPTHCGNEFHCLLITVRGGLPWRPLNLFPQWISPGILALWQPIAVSYSLSPCQSPRQTSMAPLNCLPIVTFFSPRLKNVTYSHTIKATASIIRLALFWALSSPTASYLRRCDQNSIDLYRDIMIDLRSFSDHVLPSIMRSRGNWNNSFYNAEAVFSVPQLKQLWLQGIQAQMNERMPPIKAKKK